MTLLTALRGLRTNNLMGLGAPLTFVLGVSVVNRWSAGVTVGCRFESCWDPPFIFLLQSFQWVDGCFGSPDQKVSQCLFLQ